jgi:DNA-binding MarR family transcriptional regulator
MNRAESLATEDSPASIPAEAEGDSTIILGVLNAVASDATISQRSVAKRLGIALGLANTYVKRCIKKGLIKVQQVPANRYAYYLTPKGFTEKSRLTAEYLSQGFYFFREARHQFTQLFAECERQGFTRLCLHGLTDLTEIAVMSARDRALSIVMIVDDATARGDYGGIPIVDDLPAAGSFDAVVITDLGDAQEGYEAVAANVSDHQILVPPMLGVVRRTQ